MYEPENDRENEKYEPERQDESVDMSAVSDSVAEHVERELEKHEPVKLDDDRASYSDAGYILSDEAPTTPRRYYTPPEKQERPPRPERHEPKPKKHGVFGKVVAGLMAGLLMGAAIGVGVAGMMDPPTDEPSVAEASPTPEATPTPLLTVNSGDADSKSASDIYLLATQQVVGIRTEISYNIWGRQTTSTVSGTGFIVSEDGYILTNHHVIEDAYQGGYDVNVIMYNGDSYKAEIVGFENEGSDIAVLKIDATGLTPVTIGDSSKLQVGEAVYAVGNPLGELTYTMTGGMVSALDRDITTSDQSTGVTNTINMFQIDAAVNGGNSGGPVYNSRGEVVGVVSAKYEDTGVEGLGFAIPINDAVDIANDLITQGYVSGKSQMGIKVLTVPQNVLNYYGLPVGAFVDSVVEGSGAEKAGIQPGDIITAIDEQEITGSSGLQSVLRDYRAGDSATVTVFRSGEYLKLSIVFDEQVPETQTEEKISPTVDFEDYFFGGNSSANSTF